MKSKLIVKSIEIMKNHYFILFVLYFISFCPLLINNGVFWDDWTIYFVDKTTIQKMLQEHSGFFLTYIYVFFNSFLFGPLFAKWLVFILFLFSSILFYKIIEKIKLFDKNTTLIIALLFSFLPYNSVRITTICLPYSLSYLSFFLAIYLLVLFLEKRFLLLRFLSLMFFIYAFDTNSFLVFFLIVLLYLGNYEKVNFRSVRSIFLIYLKYIDILLIPILFFSFKKLWFPTTGAYELYNQFNIVAVIASPLSFLLALKLSFFDVISSSFNLNTFFVFLLLGLYVYFKKNVKDDQVNTISNNKGILAGVVFLFLGFFAYFAIGRPGSTFGLEWASRDQLLLPLGASLLLYFGILRIQTEFLISDKIKHLIFSFLIASFCVSSFSTYWQFNIDWLKQLSLAENLKTMPEVKDNTTFIIEDNTQDLDAIDRKYRFYEYSGLMKQVFGDETRLMARAIDFKYYFVDSLSTAKVIVRPSFKMGGYQYKKPQFKIIVNYGSNLTFERTFKLLLKYYLTPLKFRKDIKDLLLVSSEKIKVDNAESVLF